MHHDPIEKMLCPVLTYLLRADVVKNNQMCCDKLKGITYTEM